MKDLVIKKKYTFTTYIGKNEHSYIYLAIQMQEFIKHSYGVKRQKGI